MKVAISGKGGVGKSTLAAAMAGLLARRGRTVLAVDADPDGNLAQAMGVPPDRRAAIVPIARHKALIEERTGAKVKQYGQMFRLNPHVSDIAAGYAVRHDGIDLLVLGAIEGGGTGCACPESVLLRALVADLVLNKDEALVMDMEAGLEHLGRSTARGVDLMLVVVEPGRRSVDSAMRVVEMAGQIGLRRVGLVANKVTCPADEKMVRDSLPDMPLLAVLPLAESIRAADRDGVGVLAAMDAAMQKRIDDLLDSIEKGPR